MGHSAKLLGTTLGLMWALVPALAGCRKEAKPEAEQPTPAAAVDPGSAAKAAAAQATRGPGDKAAEPAAGQNAQSRYDEPNFALSLAQKGPYKSGQAADLDVVLDAKAPYHINDKYPYKFKAKDVEGITFKSPVVGKDALKLDPKRAVMTVGFTPASVGKKRLAGQFSFSVCSADKCLIEKRDLALDVDVN